MPRRRKTAEEPQPIDGGGNKEDRTELANSGARADTIRAAARFIGNKEAEIKALREDINAYKQTHITGDLGFKLSDWATLYRMYQLDGDDRDKLIDTLREGFAALGVGDQLNWLDAADDAPRTAPRRRGQKVSAEPGPPVEAARQAGRSDGLAGAKTHEGDWPIGEGGAADYQLGYDEGVAQRERAATTF